MNGVQSGRDDTQVRLLDAATELFGEVGFEAATVREICRRAGANVAAVNYHFGDKLGLYTQVLLRGARFAVDAGEATAAEGTAEEKLRAFVYAYLKGLLGAEKQNTLVRLIAAEVARPTPALEQVVKQVVKPTEARVRGLISQITGIPADDDRTRMCAHSIVGQCLHYKQAAPVLKVLWPGLWKPADRLDQLATHIVEFSLAGLRAIRETGKQQRAVKQRAHGGKG